MTTGLILMGLAALGLFGIALGLALCKAASRPAPPVPPQTILKTNNCRCAQCRLRKQNRNV